MLFACDKNDMQKPGLKIKKKSVLNGKQKFSPDDDINFRKIPINNLVLLFFNNANDYMVKKEVKQVKIELPEINAKDYKVIVDYQVVDKRFIKVKNLKTGAVCIVKEGDRTGDIVLVERALRYYKFKIDNSIIKVDR